MAEQHRATADEWVYVKEHNYLAFSCLIELRDRIKALEASQSGSIDLLHLSDAEREKILKMLANPGRFEVLEVAQPAKPDSSLVERVRQAQGCGNERDARAAIREVAAWMTSNPDYHFPPALVFALEREAER